MSPPAALITGNGSAMTLAGIGGNSSGTSNYGIVVAGGNVSNSGSGTLTLAGQGGGNSGNSNSDAGIWLVNNGAAGGIVSTANGTLTIGNATIGNTTVTTTGGGSGSGYNNYGLVHQRRQQHGRDHRHRHPQYHRQRRQAAAAALATMMA